MVDLSVELAEKLLKEATQPRDQGRLVREYVERMKEFR
jgi:F0F1-type ATP synthase membrane subunit b/b'